MFLKDHNRKVTACELGRRTYPLAGHSCCLQDEIWNGPSMSLEAAVDLFGADEAYPLSEVKMLRVLCLPLAAACQADLHESVHFAPTDAWHVSNDLLLRISGQQAH